jgi:hypothetical protein
MLHDGRGMRKLVDFFNANELKYGGKLFVDVNEGVRYLMANMSATPLEFKPNSNTYFKSLKCCVRWLFPLRLTMLGQPYWLSYYWSPFQIVSQAMDC